MEPGYKKRMWICSDYGLENSYIVKRLREAKESVHIVSHDDKTDWNKVLAENPELIKEAEEKDKDIYGIGINGELSLEGINCQNLYPELRQSPVDDESVLKQVCNMLGARFTLTEQFVSAYSLRGEEGVRAISDKLGRTAEEARQAVQFWEFQDIMSKGYGIEESFALIVEKRSKAMASNGLEKEQNTGSERN